MASPFTITWFKFVLRKICLTTLEKPDNKEQYRDPTISPPAFHIVPKNTTLRSFTYRGCGWHARGQSW